MVLLIMGLNGPKVGLAENASNLSTTLSKHLWPVPLVAISKKFKTI
jgi:hypothetical protein